MLGILITARLGSQRLPDKHLRLVNNRPVMGYLLERISLEFEDEIKNNEAKIVITTSAEKKNTRFKQFQPPVDVFFGDKKNIPFRHLQASFNYDLDHIIAVDGDDILCSVEAMKDVSKLLRAGKDYVVTDGLPFGLNAFGYSTEYLNSVLQERTEQVLETGWGRIFDENRKEEKRYTHIDACKKKLRFTLDYEEDLEFFRVIIEHHKDQIYQLSDKELVSFVLENSLYKINETRVKEYWKNFKSQKEKYG